MTVYIAYYRAQGRTLAAGFARSSLRAKPRRVCRLSRRSNLRYGLPYTTLGGGDSVLLHGFCNCLLAELWGGIGCTAAAAAKEKSIVAWSSCGD